MSQRNGCTMDGSTSRSMSLDKAGHSTKHSTIDYTTLKKYVQMVKDAPSLNEEKIALIKQKMEKGTYPGKDLVSLVAGALAAKM